MIEQVTFEGKNENETLVVFTRRHWFVLLGIFIEAFFASLLPIVLIIVMAPVIVSYEGAAILFTFGWMIYLMMLWFMLAYKLTLHSLDTWIVTNERIIDIIQIGLFNRKISELNLESIQDISINTKGIVESYLNFGNVEIQTAAMAQRFMIDKVPNPLEIKDAIMDATKAREKEIHMEL